MIMRKQAIRFFALGALLLSSASSFAQALLPDFMPVVHRGRCGTSMIMEREMADNLGTRAIDTRYSYVPHTGSLTIPVILVNFKDVKFTINNPQQAFEQFFNGSSQVALGNGNQYNHGSVAQYYHDMSGGSFNLTFKVYPPITLDNNETYYGGTSTENNRDEKPRQLVADAIAKLQASSSRITDVSAMSSDGRTVDCVYIVYAGIGQNEDTNNGTAVWANTWTTAENASDRPSIAGRQVRYYSMAGELSPYKLGSNGQPANDGTIPMIAGVGVTCHELSHALGLPDFYPTNNDQGAQDVNNQSMEYWDLMDGGEYAGNGFCPTAYTAFEKNEMGWPVTIETLSENKTVTMSTSTEEGGTAYKIVNPSNSNEYIMLELIHRSGWNRNQLGRGLLVYHVNRPNGGIYTNTSFNNTANFPGMAVVPADGACLSSYIDDNTKGTVTFTVDGTEYSLSKYNYSLYGDLFPGTGNLPVDTLNATELSDAHPQPNFCWYNTAKTQKLPTNKALQNIKYDTSTGAVSFYYINDVATGIKNIPSTKTIKADDRIFSIDGSYMGTDLKALPQGIYIIGGKKVVK